MAEQRRSQQRSKPELVAAYKSVLRGYLDQRPSGARQRIARLLGTHKSFVSQITNPADTTPIPARHLGAILEVCHLSEKERETFLAAYAAAHPRQANSLFREGHPHFKTLHIEVPLVDDAESQDELERLIRDFAYRTGELVAQTVRQRKKR